MNQKELISKITAAASIIESASMRGSANYIVASKYFYDIFMKSNRNSNRKSKIGRIYGDLG